MRGHLFLIGQSFSPNVMETYKDIQFELSKRQYEREIERKAHFTTWLGLYLTINSVLFGLIYNGIRTDWITLYLRIEIWLYWIVTVGGIIFAVVAAIHLLKAFRLLDYQYLRPAPEYSQWMQRYIKKNKIDTTKEATFLREVQIEALNEKLGEAIHCNRKLNNARMGELDKSKNWAIYGYLCVLVQHCFIIVVTAIGVP